MTKELLAAKSRIGHKVESSVEKQDSSGQQTELTCEQDKSSFCHGLSLIATDGNTVRERRGISKEPAATTNSLFIRVHPRWSAEQSRRRGVDESAANSSQTGVSSQVLLPIS